MSLNTCRLHGELHAQQYNFQRWGADLGSQKWFVSADQNWRGVMALAIPLAPGRIWDFFFLNVVLMKQFGTLFFIKV